MIPKWFGLIEGDAEALDGPRSTAKKGKAER